LVPFAAGKKRLVKAQLKYESAGSITVDGAFIF
jgi:hypothetical protein